MHYQNVIVESMGTALPEERWSSAEIEKRLDPLYSRLKLNEGRLEHMTGIHERRVWPENTRPSDASAAAGREVLQHSSFERSEIDLLIHCAVSRNRLEPATAANVHDALDLSTHAQIMDISNACLGFLNAMAVAGSLIQCGHIKTALITAGENGRPLIEETIEQLNAQHLTRKTVKPWFANLTVGCASVAAIVTHEKYLRKEPLFSLHSAHSQTNSSAHQLCEGDSASGSLTMQTDSEQLLEKGVALAEDTWRNFCRHTGWNNDTPDHIICHQVGKQHQRALYQALELDMNKDHSTFPYLGNCGAASLPATLSIVESNRAFSPADKLSLLGIGSGLSSMMMGLTRA